MKTFSYAVLIVWTISVVAQDNPPARRGSIEGTVVNAATYAPLPDVRVTATASKGSVITARTDNEGRFAITGLKQDQYAIEATRTLFVRLRRNTSRLTVSLGDGESLRLPSIRLAPTAVIAGRIYNENRTPLQGVRVEALRYQYSDEYRTLVSAGHAESDSRGEYRILNLQPDTYYIRATPLRSAKGLRSAQVYYPGTVDVVDAAPIRVELGAEMNTVDISITPQETFSVRLRLASALPVGPQSNAFFAAIRRDREGESVIAPQAEFSQGVYKLSDLLPGAYELSIRLRSVAASGTFVLQTARVYFQISKEDIDLGNIVVRLPALLSGRIELSDGISLATSAIDVILRPVRIGLRASSRTGGSMSDNGNFVIPDVTAGMFRVDVTGLPPNVYLTRVRYRGEDVTDTGISVDGDGDGELEIVLSGPSTVGNVGGVVRDKYDSPVSDAIVALVPEPNRRSNPSAFRTAPTNQQGQFFIPGVRPGNYTILAWDDIEDGGYQNPELLREYEAEGAKVTVNAGGSNVLNTVRMIPSHNE